MAKQRKRTNKNIPAKGRLRDFADRLWSLAVKEDWNYKCAVCGRRDGKLDSHHIISRQHQKHRYNLGNGICLCYHCHQRDPNVAPHENAAAWLLWLSEHHPKLHSWYTETTATQAYKTFDDIVNAAYYCEQIGQLKEYVEEEDYVRIIGPTFAGWLEEEE